MREIIELTQDQIDDLVQTEGALQKANHSGIADILLWHGLRALQDGDIEEYKTPFIIYKREDRRKDRRKEG